MMFLAAIEVDDVRERPRRRRDLRRPPPHPRRQAADQDERANRTRSRGAGRGGGGAADHPPARDQTLPRRPRPRVRRANDASTVEEQANISQRLPDNRDLRVHALKKSGRANLDRECLLVLHARPGGWLAVIGRAASPSEKTARVNIVAQVRGEVKWRSRK